MDRRAILGFIVLIISMGIYNLYLCELIFGPPDKRLIKAMFYLTIAFVSIYLLIGDMRKGGSRINFQIAFITKCSLIVNFILFALILYNLLAHPVIYLFILNGSILILSIMILISGLRNHVFNKD